MDISKEFLAKLRVRVDKKVGDNRLSFFGQPLLPGGKYNQGYFIVPACFKADHKDRYLQYEWGEEYIPDEKELELVNKATEVKPELPDIVCDFPGCTFSTKFPMALVGHKRSHPQLEKTPKGNLDGFKRKTGPKPKAKTEAPEPVPIM